MGIGAWVTGMVILVVLAVQVPAAAEPMFESLSDGWEVVKSFTVGARQRTAVSTRLGARVAKLTNTILSFEGKMIQVNVIDAKDDGAADIIYKSVLQAHGNQSLYVYRDDKRIVEFANTGDAALVRQAKAAFGLVEKADGPQDADGPQGPEFEAGLFDDLPPGWELKESKMASPQQTAAISRKLGGKITLLTNNIISQHGKRLQVNIMECASKADRDRIRTYLLENKAHPALFKAKDLTVVEYVTDDITLAIKASWELSLIEKPAKARYRTIIYAAPIADADYTVWNKFCQVFSTVDSNTPDANAASQIAELCRKFKFSDSFTLRTSGEGTARPMYKIRPAPDSNEVLAGGDITKYTFKNLPRILDVPWFKMAAIITTTPDANTGSSRKADEKLLGATKFWPVDDAEIKELADKITAGKTQPDDKVQAILQWLKPGKNMKFDGPVGSRHGVKKALKQRYGRTWDFSDCFITLCRASGVPCRQVAGWYYGVGGHIWAEVLFEGKGFRQVDPTGGGLVDCGIYHIAYLTSEDGVMPIVYLGEPRVEFLYQHN